MSAGKRSTKAKLELTWIGKDNQSRLEPRILLEDSQLSYSASQRVTEEDLFENRLIFGDNLLVLKALEHEFAGKVKCVFIDPPYNTGSAFDSYEDGVEHSIWLTLMRDRLLILRNLLSEDGTIWITLDDNEAHYLKVLGDELFGRANFIGTIVWEKSDSPRMDAQFFSSRHDYILVFAKDISKARISRLDTGELPAHYNRVDEHGRPYYLKPLRAMGGDDSRENRPTLYFGVVAPDGSEVFPTRRDGSAGRWRWSQARVERDRELLEWIDGRDGWSLNYRIYANAETNKRPVETIWTHQEVGSNRTSKAEITGIFGRKAFDTPKPEALIHRILSISTQPGDLVLDSFLGSGTTAAVAHKMKRRWIGIEVLDHAVELVVPRLRGVIDGKDGFGVSDQVQWGGGGGFRFYRIAPSLLQVDKLGQEPEMVPEPNDDLVFDKSRGKGKKRARKVAVSNGEEQ